VKKTKKSEKKKLGEENWGQKGGGLFVGIAKSKGEGGKS